MSRTTARASVLLLLAALGSCTHLATGAAPFAVEHEVPGERHDTETYDVIVENPFVRTDDQPLSTFAVDVDTASYSNTRRFLEHGTLPPPGAVRIEELVNYFRYDYPEPAGADPFSVHTEVAACPWEPAHRLVHIGLKGRSLDDGVRPSSNLVFLIDVSGSMATPNKLPLVQRSLRLLVDRMDGRDSIAIAVYAGEAGVVLEPTSGVRKAEIMDAVDGLVARGSTNGGAGIELAYSLARKRRIEGGVNRVLLVTDGDFNVGVTSQSELVRIVEAERRSAASR